MIKKPKRTRKTKVKFYVVEGLKCQGRKEVKYLKECIRYHWDLPTKAKKVSTPIGFYTPDFEHPDRYIEIKSLHTLEVCIGKVGYKGIDEPSDLQFRKICWVAKNIKPVHMIIYLGKDEYLPELDIEESQNVIMQFKGGRTKKIKKF